MPKTNEELADALGRLVTRDVYEALDVTEAQRVLRNPETVGGGLKYERLQEMVGELEDALDACRRGNQRLEDELDEVNAAHAKRLVEDCDAWRTTAEGYFRRLKETESELKASRARVLELKAECKAADNDRFDAKRGHNQAVRALELVKADRDSKAKAFETVSEALQVSNKKNWELVKERNNMEAERDEYRAQAQNAAASQRIEQQDHLATLRKLKDAEEALGGSDLVGLRGRLEDAEARVETLQEAVDEAEERANRAVRAKRKAKETHRSRAAHDKRTIDKLRDELSDARGLVCPNAIFGANNEVKCDALVETSAATERAERAEAVVLTYKKRLRRIGEFVLGEES